MQIANAPPTQTGPAVHLVNLIPPTASLATPSVPTVHEMLTRANLPAATIALAVCILDSLNSRFSHHWRVACPSAQLHIDAVRPEVIILASLIIAHKFLEDSQEPTHRYARKWGGDAWTCEQINVTERCIMENLGYRILPLWDRELIEDALADMERAGRQAVLDLHRGEHKQHQPVMSSGKATLGLGMQLTPLETPESENLPRRPAGGGDGGALQVAFIRGPTQDFTLYPLEVLPGAKRDSFPSPPADEISSMG